MIRSPKLVLVLAPVTALVLAGALPAGAQRTPAAAACTIWFTGASETAPHDWKTPDNWALTDGGAPAGRIPTSTDTVCMSTTPATADVVVRAVNPTIRAVDFSATGARAPSLTVTGRLRLLSGPSTLNDLAADGATLAGAGLLTLTGTADVSDTVTLDLARVTNAGTLLLQPAAVVQTTSAAAGSAPGLLNKGAVRTAGTSGSPGVALDGPLTNAGSISTVGAAVTLGGGNVTGTTDTGTWTASAAPITLTADRTVTGGRTFGGQPVVVDGVTLTANRPNLSIKTLRLTGGGRLLAQQPASISALTSDDGVLDGGSTVTLTGVKLTRPTNVVHQLTVDSGTTLMTGGMTLDGRLSILGGATVDVSSGLVLTGTDVTIDTDTDGDHGSNLVLDGNLYGQLDPAGTAVISARTTVPHRATGVTGVLARTGTVHLLDLTNLTAGGALSDVTLDVANGAHLVLPRSIITNNGFVRSFLSDGISPSLASIRSSTYGLYLGGSYVSHNHGLTNSNYLLLDPTAALHVDDFTTTVAATVAVELNCDDPHPLIAATGPVVIDGSANAIPECGTEPPIGTTFTVIRGASVTGVFTADPNARYQFSYTPTAVLVTRVS